MDLVLMIAIFIAGLILIIKGGGYFVDAASWIAGVSGIPKVIVGATIVSVATTMPEMIVSVMAAGQGKADMSVGNAVGSVTANLGLIMAIAILCMPGPIRRRDYFVKSILMLAAAAIIAAAGRRGAVERGLSLLLLAVFGAFLVENVRSAAAAGGRGRTSRAAPEKRAVLINGVKFFMGAVGVVLGADLLVDSGSALARLAGVSERMIGVTIVAVGTSLPELVTTVAAVVKKQSALSVGNILGANIIDLTLILPLSGLLAGQAMPISAAAGRLDLPACLLVGAAAVLPPMFTRKFQRWQGAALLSLYAGYLYLTCQI
ncbi:MAG: calcium/sodium antiporter [Oscillospiraceae bacterium]|nr:calcium/sodium antiporter [Oscillospiraceae bacterium]